MNRFKVSGYWPVLGPGFIFSCFFAILSITACAPESPVLLGYVGGLSGRVADLGISGRNGAILAVENINSTGGVNGRKIKLVVKDDKQEGKKAEKAVKDLIDQGGEPGVCLSDAHEHRVVLAPERLQREVVHELRRPFG